ncbi:MAG: dual specificity protein phosphatase family protein [Parcubacteria group bacterium]|nr:dual specificity protein phosphatase family protein [Parcubacteria group bacterium]
MTHPQSILDFDYITDGIYIGTNQCCQTHFDERLKKKGITADISLEKERLDAPFGVDFYVWLPVPDFTPPAPDQLEFGVLVLEKIVSMGKKVYVHCKEGHGRAPTLMAAYLVKKGKTPEQAEAFIRSKRAPVHLGEVQRQALRNFSAKIKRRPFAKLKFLG